MSLDILQVLGFRIVVGEGEVGAAGNAEMCGASVVVPLSGLYPDALLATIGAMQIRVGLPRLYVRVACLVFHFEGASLTC
jgi:hypothetical protein